MSTSRRIFVIDDPELVTFVKALLTAEGFEVECATSTREARGQLATVAWDLVISDLRMWGSPPAALLEVVGDGNGGPPRIPVLVCTGAEDEAAAAAEWFRTREIEVLLKPFDIDDFLARVTRLSQYGGQRDS